MKQDLRDTYPYGLFAVPMEDVVRVHASSGTTGKQIVVGYTQHDLDVWSECCARALTAAGATNKEFYACFLRIWTFYRRSGTSWRS